jgi:hypothetical protein
MVFWHVDDFEAKPVWLSFSSAGGGSHSSSAIHAQGVRLINALGLVDFDAVATQVEVCESCGTTHCKSGGWVALRRLQDSVIWIPAWSEMDGGDWERSEYRPPAFIETHGAPTFTAPAWERLRQLHGGAAQPQALPSLTTRELARLLHWVAPAHLLGEYPAEPRLRRQVLVAVSEGDLEAEARRVDELLHAWFVAPVEVEIVESLRQKSSLEFWLDVPGTPRWNCFASVHPDEVLLADGGLLLRAAAG